MQKNLIVGILRETYGKYESRAPLTPKDVKWLVEKGVKVEVESSKTRVFKDEQYREAGAKVVDRFKSANFLLGIKPPKIKNIYKDKIYMIFSHTTKGQRKGRSLVKEFIKSGAGLIDYEKITDLRGRRLVYFGRFAGICGLIDSLYYLGRKLKWQGIKNPFLILKPAHRYNSLNEIIKGLSLVKSKIKEQGFDRRISPFIIGISGRGNVSRGVQEMLEFLEPLEIHCRDIVHLIRHRLKNKHKNIYKVVFLRSERIRSKEKKRFNYREYLNDPGAFESNMDMYFTYLNLFIHASYWDSHFPRLVTPRMMDELSSKNDFRFPFIGDISCDVNGGIELTYKTATREKPVFTYNIKKKKFTDGYKTAGITILSIDNLPSELPKEASEDFSRQIRNYVYQIALDGLNRLKVPREIREAVVFQNKKLTKKFSYLKKFL